MGKAGALLAAAGEQKKGETRDPVMKWVYEANNTISALNGSAAMADGSNVIWMWDAALGTSDYTFFTFIHETAHNQDGRYFYGGAGRREGTGGESLRLLPAGGRHLYMFGFCGTVRRLLSGVPPSFPGSRTAYSD
ncbi:MAG TPA: hypothetical protein IAB71_09440 [Candidatus Scatomonas pullistercoris]|uniref:Peptidase M26 C-terminal domain-containing protein n=1 Tax=Candidatus Scatomonas pullistercoris TaxID=2840920 RepID=A0A9D1TBB5_9FIRM|nr:hypothetical protein [Candidatus Scatomonas pullistercoris]